MILEPISGRSDCRHEYINASYIDGYNVDKKFIATQGELTRDRIPKMIP